MIEAGPKYDPILERVWGGGGGWGGGPQQNLRRSSPGDRSRPKTNRHVFNPE